MISPLLRTARFRAAAPHLSGRILDFGCLDGGLYSYLRPESYFGIDFNPMAIRIARELHPGVEFDLQPKPGSVFDGAACLAVVEHLEDPTIALDVIRKSLKIKGKLVITTPKPEFRWLHEFGAKIGLCSKQGAAEHHELFNRARLESICRKCGFHLILYRTFLGGLNQLFVFEREK